MPSPKSALGVVGGARSFMSLVKEIDFEEVRERAEQAPRITLIAPNRDMALEAANRVFGPQPERYVDVRDEENLSTLEGARIDLIVVYDPDGTGLLNRVNATVRDLSRNTVFFLASGESGDDAAEALRREITVTFPDLAPSLGRHFVPFRGAAAKAIIDETSRINAQFALVSNVPAIVPILGGFISASADLLVLTKNQIMMAYKLAAIYGRDLHNQTRILRELAPVVGGGFLWRTIAREATSFIPFAAGTIPKVAIAFAGTYSTGRAVDYYYRFGNRPDKDQLKAFAKQAAELAGRINLPGRLGDGSKDEA